MSGRTPGPWEASEAKTIDGETMVLGGEGQDFGLIAVVTLPEDAPLVAAAPELLEQLQNLVGLAENRGGLHQYRAALDDARALIAKAKGV